MEEGFEIGDETPSERYSGSTLCPFSAWYFQAAPPNFFRNKYKVAKEPQILKSKQK